MLEQHIGTVLPKNKFIGKLIERSTDGKVSENRFISTTREYIYKLKREKEQKNEQNKQTKCIGGLVF